MSRGKRRQVLKNILPVSSRFHTTGMGCLARGYFETHYISQLLIFSFPGLNRDSIKRVHRFSGLENLEKALAKGNGCILIHPHFGPVHLPLFHLGLLGYNIWQLGYLRKPKGLSRIGETVAFRLREEYESIIPARIIDGSRFLRQVFRHLKSKGTLMITGDGTGGGEFLGRFKAFPFLGKSMLFPIGPGLLAIKTGSSLLPVFTVPDKERLTFRTIIEPPLFDPDMEGSQDEAALTMGFISLLEMYIKQYPWLWHFWDEFSGGKLLV